MRPSSLAALTRVAAAQSQTAQPPQPAPAADVLAFDDAVQRAIAANPTAERAATAVRSAEALLAQARAAVRPSIDGSIVTTVLDGERGFSGNVVQPQTQVLFAGSASTPVLAMAQWAARAQAAERVGLARLSADDVRRQVGVAAAEAYLSIVGAKRQVEVNERARDTAQAQLDYARARREGGVGSRLNELRAAQELAVVQEAVEQARLAVALGQEALGLITSSDRPVDTTGEPALEAPAADGESWLRNRTDIKLFDARIDAAGHVAGRQLEGLGADRARLVRAAVHHAVGLVLAVRHLAGGGDGHRADLRRRPAPRRKGVPRSGRVARQGRPARTASCAPSRACARPRGCRSTPRRRALERSREAATHAAEVLRITDVAFRAGATTNIELVDAQRRSRDAETAVRRAEDRARLARLALLVALGQFPR